jgi:hypothetical protein
MPKPLDPVVKLQREVQRLKTDNSVLREVNKKLARRGAGYDNFIEELQGFLKNDTFKFKSSSVAKKLDPFDPTHEEIACAACSDLHLTENVRLEDSNGINVYNSIIASNRLWVHAQKIKSILARHMAMYKIKYLWVPMLGDMINGSIHPELVITNDLSDPAAVVLCSRLLYMFLEELKGLGLPVFVDTIIGNHPRTTLKMPTKRQAHTSLDWLIYENLADRFKDDSQVDIKVWTSQIGMRQHFGHRVVFEHGIDVKSGHEEAFEDRLRALFDDPTYRQATGLKGSAFDQIVIGNMHKAKFLERTIVNGTYTGQNELGMSWRLKPIKALQLMWGMSKKQVRTWEYAIDLTDVKSSKAENPFSDYCSWFMKKHGKG